MQFAVNMLDKMADANEDGLENEHFETHEEDEESLIRYFYRGFDYKEIIAMFSVISSKTF